VLCKILSCVVSKAARNPFITVGYTYQLIPVDRHTSAVYVGRVPILEVLQTRVARFLQAVKDPDAKRGSHSPEHS
jgi:hypothetical protein